MPSRQLEEACMRLEDDRPPRRADCALGAVDMALWGIRGQNQKKKKKKKKALGGVPVYETAGRVRATTASRHTRGAFRCCHRERDRGRDRKSLSTNSPRPRPALGPRRQADVCINGLPSHGLQERDEEKATWWPRVRSGRLQDGADGGCAYAYGRKSIRN